MDLSVQVSGLDYFVVLFSLWSLAITWRAAHDKELLADYVGTCSRSGDEILPTCGLKGVGEL